VVGPVAVTVASPDGDDEIVDADTLRFVGRYVTIDSTRNGSRYLITVPTKRVAKIAARVG
jgi:hypothetical protein